MFVFWTSVRLSSSLLFLSCLPFRLLFSCKWAHALFLLSNCIFSVFFLLNHPAKPAETLVKLYYFSSSKPSFLLPLLFFIRLHGPYNQESNVEWVFSSSFTEVRKSDLPCSRHSFLSFSSLSWSDFGLLRILTQHVYRTGQFRRFGIFLLLLVRANCWRKRQLIERGEAIMSSSAPDFSTVSPPPRNHQCFLFFASCMHGKKRGLSGYQKLLRCGKTSI